MLYTLERMKVSICFRTFTLTVPLCYFPHEIIQVWEFAVPIRAVGAVAFINQPFFQKKSFHAQGACRQIPTGIVADHQTIDRVHTYSLDNFSTSHGDGDFGWLLNQPKSPSPWLVYDQPPLCTV